MDKDVLHQIEQALGHEFTDPELLLKSFTHSSSVDNRLDSNGGLSSRRRHPVAIIRRKLSE
jgi:dsRNA-specific ribonuclease